MIISSNPHVSHNSLIGWFHRSTHSIRAISALVITCISWLSVYPLAAAAEEAAKKPPASAQPAKAEEDKHGKTIEKIEGQLRALDTKLKGKKSWDAEKQALKTLKDSLEDLDRVALSEFDRDLEHINKHKLSDVIRQRHTEAVSKFKAESGKLKADLETITAGQDGAQIAATVKQSLERIKAQTKKRHAPFDPNNLPFRTPSSKVRAPKLTQKEFAELFPKEQVLLADNGSDAANIVIAQAMNLPSAADLAPTEDVQITDAIKAKAAELNHNPVEIYNWVHNNIEFIPTYGSIQGSHLTLDKKQGNSFDTASLLIALLRASNIPARYVYGAIEVPTVQALNWLGGFESPSAAQELLGQGGVPSGFVTSGGKALALRMEHVWVEAWVDFHPSKGAKNIKGDSWAPLDASFKQYAYSQGIDLQNEAPFDGDALIGAAQQGSTYNLSEGWAQNLNHGNVRSVFESYRDQLRTTLENNHPGATMGDVFGSKIITPRTTPTLAAGLPYKRIVTGLVVSALPSTLRHRFQYNIYLDSHQRAIENPLMSYQVSTPTIAGKKLTLVFIPASDDDRKAIQSYLPQPHSDGSPIEAEEFASQLPAYGIHVRAELRVEDVMVATAGIHKLATELVGEGGFTSMDLTSWDITTDPLVVGQTGALGISLQGVAPSQFSAHEQRLSSAKSALQEGQFADLTRRDILGDVLNTVALGYFVAVETLGERAQIRARMVENPGLSYGFFYAQVVPVKRYGITMQAGFPGLLMDIGHQRRLVSSINHHKGAFVLYNRVRGQHSSASEHTVPERFFSLPSDTVSKEGVSAVKAIGVAAAQGQKIFTITQANRSQLQNVSQSASVIANLGEALDAGREVIVHQNPIHYAGFHGAGYIVTDPETGGGAYIIEGGSNGQELIDAVGKALAQLGLSKDQVMDAAGVFKTVLVEVLNKTLLAYVDLLVELTVNLSRIWNECEGILRYSQGGLVIIFALLGFIVPLVLFTPRNFLFSLTFSIVFSLIYSEFVKTALAVCASAGRSRDEKFVSPALA